MQRRGRRPPQPPRRGRRGARGTPLLVQAPNCIPQDEKGSDVPARRPGGRSAIVSVLLPLRSAGVSRLERVRGDPARRTRTRQYFDEESGDFKSLYLIRETRVIDEITGAMVPMVEI